MRKVGLALVIFSAALGISPVVLAATITLDQDKSSHESRITISGEITSEDFSKFKEVALRTDHAVVYLDGPGGWANGGRTRRRAIAGLKLNC